MTLLAILWLYGLLFFIFYRNFTVKSSNSIFFMYINHVAFAGSYPRESLCPSDGKPEYAFIGRSNVGKSSLINMLVDRKNIAHTSGTPGKTQHINYYLVNNEWYLVDLPGYGYARISKSKRREWEQMIRGYLKKRMTLQCTFVLIDANVPPQQIDIEFINSLGEEHIPFMIVYTKTDRLKPHEVDDNIEKIQKALLEHWNILPQQFITSANTRLGAEPILELIGEVNQQYFNAL
jgi:GTP-binding protein